MKCPKCDFTLSISDRQGIEMEYCTQCMGIWLDRGEIDKIVARSQCPHQKKSDYEDDIGEGPRNWDFRIFGKFDEDYTRGRQRKSRLDELFDF